MRITWWKLLIMTITALALLTCPGMASDQQKAEKGAKLAAAAQASTDKVEAVADRAETVTAKVVVGLMKKDTAEVPGVNDQRAANVPKANLDKAAKQQQMVKHPSYKAVACAQYYDRQKNMYGDAQHTFIQQQVALNKLAGKIRPAHVIVGAGYTSPNFAAQGAQESIYPLACGVTPPMKTCTAAIASSSPQAKVDQAAPALAVT